MATATVSPRDIESVIPRERSRAAIAEVGKSDLFYLASVILGYDKITLRTHGPLCRFFDTCKLPRRMMLMPRSHYKSTLITISGTIQDIIKNPNETILLCASTHDNASRFLEEIKRHFANNAFFQWLYPEVIWDDISKAPRWNKFEMEVPRSTFVREPTVDTIGARGEVVSRHYTKIRLDDIIGENEFQSETEMRRTCEWLSGVEVLLVPPFDERTIDIVGTRWRLDDVYSYAEFIYGGGKSAPRVPLGPYATKVGDHLAIFSRAARENGESIFPELFPNHVLEHLQASDPERYAAQMSNDPLAEGVAEFRPEWLRYYTLDERGMVVLQDDPEPLDVHKCPIFILCDPSLGEKSTSDRTAIIVVAADLRRKSPRLIMLECFVKRVPPNEIIDKWFELAEKYPTTRVLSVETIAFQKALKYWAEEREMRTRKPLPVVYEYKAGGNKAKVQRIKALIPLCRSGQLYIQRGFTEFLEEYVAWHPAAKHDDALDCLAQILDHFDFGWTKEVQSDFEEFNRFMAECRSVLTGY